ncbi:MAG: CRISPR-associated endoribonuclease Cas6 [Chloroflexi bacterium]|nr:CRISPR-associated endoribonuclease Cas6 [Chloroflexota bacterium]
MLLSTVITLRATEPIILPPQGRATHAWFLERVRAYDPRLSEALHQPNQIRPFTVSDVCADLNRPAEGLALKPGQRCYVRLTSLVSELSTLLVEQALPGLPDHVRLGNATLPIQAYTIDPLRDLWANSASFESIWQKNQIDQPAFIAMHFASPTVFKSRGSFMPVPLPRLVFESLLNRWNAFSMRQLPQQFIDLADAHVALSSYRLQARQLSPDGVRRKQLPAFWGTCNYAILQNNQNLFRMLHVLAEFAFYAGIGKETARGFGQARRVVMSATSSSPANPSVR